MRVTIEKKTDQLNFEDFLGGITRTVTIAGVTKGTREQQYDIAIEGDTRVWRPAPTVLKLLVLAWTDEATEWVGHRATLYGDSEVMFGRDKVGGIRVSHLSHLPDGKPLSAWLTETRGKKKKHTVDPLTDERSATRTTEPLTDAMIACCTDQEQLRAWWNEYPDQQTAIAARKAELDATDGVDS